jgi:LemA protein
MPWWIYLVAVLAVLALIVLAIYNGVVKAQNKARESWSGVDVQLRRRRDLVPNLVASVGAYAKHEAQALTMVTEMRAGAESAAHAGPPQAVPAENRLTGALRGLFAVAERYPELKADANFLQLSGELVNIENNVAAARAIYNSNARRYNDRIQTFPANTFIGSFGFRALPYVEAAARERGVGRVDFA